MHDNGKRDKKQLKEREELQKRQMETEEKRKKKLRNQRKKDQEMSLDDEAEDVKE